MNNIELKQLKIELLRGSIAPFALPFEKGKKLTVVYGENATGKSTICDAFDFLGNGRVGSLENRGLGKTAKYWHSVGKKASDVSVTLETRDGAICSGTIVKSEVVVAPSERRPRVEVLRRSQILALLEANPGEKYAAISRFIDVSELESSEAALRSLIRDLSNNRDVAVARVQENQDHIRQFWEQAGKPEPGSLVWAGLESRRNPTSSDAEIVALTTLQGAYLRLQEHPVALKTSAIELKLAKDAAEFTAASAAKAAKIIAADATELVAVLDSARAYLRTHAAPSECPVCESAEKVDALRTRIDDRLVAFAELQEVQRQATIATSQLQRATQKVDTLRVAVRKHIDAFDFARDGFTWPADIALPPSVAPKNVDDLELWLTQSALLPDEWKKAETSRRDLKQFVGTLKRAVKTYNENIQAQKDLDALLPKLSRALEIMEEERHAFSKEVLTKIAADVGRIYELVHPGEGLNTISLALDPDRRASLEIEASFGGQINTPPQAYFSESHLDTLGLCVFIALAALDGPENTILVLDDVLASVDEPHVERLIEMLYAEAIKFRHCVITTHYRPWKQKLRWGWLRNGQCQFVELSKWTNKGGMTLVRSIPDVERLGTLLVETPPDPQLVCAKAGVILEAALDFLTQLYECPVPRKAEGRYTLGDLLPSVDKKLRKSLAVEVLVTDSSGATTYETKNLGPILDELTRIAQARNVFGAHFSELSFDLLDADGIGFGKAVFALMENLADPEAGWPRSSKSGKYWANSGETRRLHPLRQPT